MYTQCPDCHTAFPVTARVLQQAAGRVRCGRCGQPFNALESLSEDPPESGDVRDDSRSVLDALEALAGPEDIRIEDTGVEWRVVDEDDLDDPDAGAVDDDDARESDRSAVRWHIEDADPEPADNDSGTGGEPPRQAEDEASLAPHKTQQSLQLAAGPGEEELRYDDNTPLPDDFDEDVESHDPPRRRAEDFTEPRSREFDERQVDLTLGDPGEWMALLDELGVGEDERERVDELLTPVGDAEDTQSSALADIDTRRLEDGDEEAQSGAGDEDYPRDIDTQFDLQALELGIEVTGSRAPADEDSGAELGLEDDGDDEAALLTDGGAREPDSGAGESLEFELVEEEPEELELSTDTGSGEDSLSAGPFPADHAVEQDRPEDETLSRIHVDEQRFAPESPAGGAAGAVRDLSAHEPAPLTEEELTVNRLIDQDLLRFAQEQDALGSTTAGMQTPREAPHVETIIMEGELVRTALDDDEVDSAAPGDTGEGDQAQDLPATWLESKPATPAEETPAEPRSWGAIAGIAFLGLLLLVQVVHAWRESLATNGVFERAAAPVYRLLGAPLVPNWDARGWQFQATNGATNATGDVLGISSRIANESGRALPYPLIYLSLTDRWEEPVGASVLQPIEYLSPDRDSTALVPPGESFDASITIRSLSPDASGFKLNVCYPADAGRLRCAIEDFRK